MEHDDPLVQGGVAEPHAASLDEDGIDWRGIKHAFVHGDWSVARIADAFGPSRTTIYDRARAEGWVRLVGTKPLRPGPKPRYPGAPKTSEDQLRRSGFIKRLFKLLDNQLTAMEQRMDDAKANSPELSAAEIEREARAVSTIAGCYAKIVELDEAARKAGKGSEVSTVRSAEDADRLRRDLAERLERLIPPRTG